MVAFSFIKNKPIVTELSDLQFGVVLENYRNILKFSSCTIFRNTSTWCLHRNNRVFSPCMNFQAKVNKHLYFEVAQRVKWLIACLESIGLDLMSPVSVPGNPFSPRGTKFHC